MAEKECIEREAAIKTVSDWYRKALHSENMSSYNEGERAAYRTALSEIANLPAADVRPVVRGHKVTHNRPIAGYWASGKLDGGWDGMEGRVWVEPIMDNPVDYCSECGKRLDDTFQNFCPNCGADMRTGAE